MRKITNNVTINLTSFIENEVNYEEQTIKFLDENNNLVSSTTYVFKTADNFEKQLNDLFKDTDKSISLIKQYFEDRRNHGVKQVVVNSNNFAIPVDESEVTPEYTKEVEKEVKNYNKTHVKTPIFSRAEAADYGFSENLNSAIENMKLALSPLNKKPSVENKTPVEPKEIDNDSLFKTIDDVNIFDFVDGISSRNFKSLEEFNEFINSLKKKSLDSVKEDKGFIAGGIIL